MNDGKRYDFVDEDGDRCSWAYIESVTRPIYVKNVNVTAGKCSAPVEEKSYNTVPVKKLSCHSILGSIPPKKLKSSLHKDAITINAVSPTCTNTFPIYREDYGMISSIDRSTKTRIDKGLYPIDNTLDLHGYTQSSAFDAFLNFITDSFKAGHRCVLVITGWGSKSAGKSSLRSNFHKWLQSDFIAKAILYYTQATGAHGGQGAFYILLKSNRKS